ncbi:hypothetical protein HPP92_018149 [Vanilla planifolia]|uniref:Uncharacterized protein n=1 Tax=Vanilla planifolia TaxID=51239 RepID=A0A835UNM8_VANPL|nr:hypothetical protein HPP92_018735 [Vanilla planifolia]KAG0468821.1 hypothetical protein HPP92_018149 [Vanilla planifolia]
MAELSEAYGGEATRFGWWKPSFRRDAGSEVRSAGKEAESMTAAAAVVVVEKMTRKKSGGRISDATLCMIMDRFAPS